MRRRVAVFALIALAASALVAWPARAETVKMRADLAGASEVPANDSAGRGTATLEFDTVTRVLTWVVTYNGLKAPATAAHIHGPAAASTNAGVVVPFAGPASPIRGRATLTAAQAADLMAGRYYVNIHSSAFPAGEIRGQIRR